MSHRENLIFEMKNLNKILCKYLEKIKTEKLDDTAWLELNDGCGSVLYALQWYFGDGPQWNITILTPDD